MIHLFIIFLIHLLSKNVSKNVNVHQSCKAQCDAESMKPMNVFDGKENGRQNNLTDSLIISIVVY